MNHKLRKILQECRNLYIKKFRSLYNMKNLKILSVILMRILKKNKIKIIFPMSRI